MLRKVKEIFGGKDVPGEQEILLGDIPALLSDIQEGWDTDIGKAVSTSRQVILGIRDRLVTAVHRLSESKRDGRVHPKLEKIVSNSLPQFEKALLLALSRQLPEDAGEFYLACSESLKGCVKALAGPGRYLRNVFPEEMKEIRAIIDEFGKEINALTPRMAESRARREKTRAIRDAHARALDLERSLERICRDIPAVEARVSDLRQSAQGLQDTIESCSRGMAEDHAFQAAGMNAARFEKELMDIDRQLGATFSTLAHVLRKAAKIAQRSDAGRTARDLNHAVHIIDGQEIPAMADAEREIGAVLPIVSSMIASGEIQLKNQEERDLFSHPERIPEMLSTLIRERSQSKERVEGEREQLKTHPLRVRCREAEEALNSVRAELREKEKHLQEITKRQMEMEKELPLLYAQIEEQLSLLLGKKFRIPPQ